MDPNDIIDTIVDAIDYAEIARDMQGLIKARRLLKNDLRQAIDEYVQIEVTKVLDDLVPATHEGEASLFMPTPIESGD
jgi:HD superfamily phosphohydrolase YqeK